MTEGQAAEKPKKRKGLLAFYISTGVVILLVLASVKAWSVYRARVQLEGGKFGCTSFLRQIAQCCEMYADDYDGEYPPSMQYIVPEYLDNPRVLCCPGVPKESVTYMDFNPGGIVTESSSNYRYEVGLREGMPAHLILVYDKTPENHKGTGRNAARLDARVIWWPASREAELQEKLKKQREAVKKWRDAGAKKEDIEKFFGKSGANQ